jgi:hypothetical protein
MYDLLGHVQGNENLLRKPIRPAITGYPQKGRPSAARSRAQTHDGTPGQGASEGLTLSLGHEPREITFSDLTADGQKSFNMAWSFYQDDTKAYERQQDLIRKLKGWIAANVSSHYQETCCEPTESIAEWYKNLKMAAGIDVRSEETNARERYKEALKTPKMEDFTTWVDSWEKTMTVAKKKKVVETTKTSIWFQDFLAAIRGTLPMWAAAYGISKDPQVDNDTLDYRKVANDLRREAGQYTANKIDNGSFGPAFVGQEDHRTGGDVQETPDRDDVQEISEEEFEDATESKRGPQRKGKQKYKTANQKRKNAPGDFSGKVCRGCEGFHLTQRCFYLFPEKAPEEWTPKPHIQKLVEQNLKDDSTLEEEIKRWMKSQPE